MAETETVLDPESKALAEAAAREKTDMQAGADVEVPKGDELRPQERIDPASARKALYKKQRESNAADIETGRSRFPEVAALEDAVNVEVGAARHDELHRTDHTALAAERKPEPGKPVTDGGKPAPKGKYNFEVDKDGQASVIVDGKTLKAPAAEVEEAGGIVPYQKLRAAAIRLRQASEESKRLQQEREEIAGLRKKLEDQLRDPATTTTGAAGGGSPPAKGATGDAAVQAEAERITGLLYKGDQKAVTEAVASILSANRGHANLSVDEIADRAAAKLRERENPNNTDEIAAFDTKDKADANAYMRENHAAILDDPDLLQIARRRFDELAADPSNEGRTRLQIAKEVGKHISEKFKLSPRAGVLERKREMLPAVPAGGGRAPDDTPTTMSPSDYIAKLRQRSGKQD